LRHSADPFTKVSFAVENFGWRSPSELSSRVSFIEVLAGESSLKYTSSGRFLRFASARPAS
jgi:hypothetical protein